MKKKGINMTPNKIHRNDFLIEQKQKELQDVAWGIVNKEGGIVLDFSMVDEGKKLIEVSEDIYKLIRHSEKIAASTTISTLKDECETNYVYGIDEFTKFSSKGYEMGNDSITSCLGDPNHGFINLIPKSSNENPSFHYEFKSGLITCSIEKGELTQRFLHQQKHLRSFLDYQLQHQLGHLIK